MAANRAQARHVAPVPGGWPNEPTAASWRDGGHTWATGLAIQRSHGLRERLAAAMLGRVIPKSAPRRGAFSARCC